jgi:hypothetical protein
MKKWHYIGLFFILYGLVGFVVAGALFTAKELPELISFIGEIFFWTFLPALWLGGLIFGIGFLIEFFLHRSKSQRNNNNL